MDRRMGVLQGEGAVASAICQGGRRGTQEASTTPHEPLEGKVGEQRGDGGVMTWQRPAMTSTKNAHSVEEGPGAGRETMWKEFRHQ
jgi:hypothetical protein